MRNFIVLLLLSFAFMLGVAAPEPPNLAQPVEQKEGFSAPNADLQTCFVGVPKSQTESQGVAAKLHALRLNLFLWMERLRTQKHENLSHEQAKMLGFNHSKEPDIWDFSEDLKAKETANKTLFVTPDYTWQNSKIATEK